MTVLITRPRTRGRAISFLILAAILWSVAYWLNEHLWTALARAAGANLEEPIPSAVHFFFYDSGKVLLLLVGMIFLIGMLRTALRPESVRDYLLDKPLWLSLSLAVLLGAVTPFCSCSSIPLFIGFVAAGIPLSVTLAFLIASPLVNEVAVVMLAQSFGPAITSVYVLSGLGMALLLGALLSRFDLDDQVKEFVRLSPTARLHSSDAPPSLNDRIEAGAEETKEILGRVWKWVLIGVAIGALIHGWIPADLIARYGGRDNPLAVVAAVAFGAPLYSNAAGVIPIAQALWAKGMATGTVLAFMMSTVALSIPEFILLKQVVKNKLLGVYFGSVTASIILIGLGLNLVFD